MPQLLDRKLASSPTPADKRCGGPSSRSIRGGGEDDQELCGPLPSVWRDSAGHKKVEISSTGARFAGKGGGRNEYELEKPMPKTEDGREIELPRFCMPRLDDLDDPAMVANRCILDNTIRLHGKSNMYCTARPWKESSDQEQPRERRIRDNTVNRPVCHQYRLRRIGAFK